MIRQFSASLFGSVNYLYYQMPFTSIRQMQTCFGRRLSAKAKGKKVGSWDCDEFLRATPDAECLPTLVGGIANRPRTHSACRKRPRTTAPEISVYYRGARGGIYFYADGVAIYVPKDAKAYVEKHESVRPASEDSYKKRRK
jgi:hypothetical protein